MCDKRFSYWGIDGCKGGWLCIGLSDNGEHHALVACNIDQACEKIKELGGKIALIDIPIGLSNSKNERECDKLARKKIGARRSSVFRVPCRQAIEAYKKGDNEAQKEENGKIASVKITDGCLSAQTWGIVPKIVEVDDFMQSMQVENPTLREVHPEVCFQALTESGDTLKYNKKKDEGEIERRKILQQPRLGVGNIKVGNIKAEIRCEYKKAQVADDDILDALIAAVTAKLGYQKGKNSRTLNTLPSKPPNDCFGRRMEMVYVLGFNPEVQQGVYTNSER